MLIKRRYDILVLITLFIFLYFINAIFPLQSDDIKFAKFSSFADSINNAKRYYMEWNGRLGELFRVSFGDYLSTFWFYPFVNAAIGVGVIYFFFFLLFARFPRNDFTDITSICFILFFLMSASISFGSVFFWQSGSMLHLWAWLLILAFLIPYRVFFSLKMQANERSIISALLNINVMESRLTRLAICSILSMKDSISKTCCFFILAFLAGFSQEFNIVLIITLLMLSAFCLYKKIHLPTWFYIGILGFICGWVLLYLSPGSKARLQLFIDLGFAIDLHNLTNMSFGEILARIVKIFYQNNSGFASIAICVVWIIAICEIQKTRGMRIFLSVLVAILGGIFYGFKLGFYFLHIGIISLIFLAYYFKDSNIRFYKLIVIITFLVCLISLYMDAMFQIGSLFSRAKLHFAFINMAMMLALMWYLRDFKGVKILRKIFVVLCIAQIIHVSFACVDARLRWEKMLDSIARQKAAGKRDIVIDSKLFKTPYYRRYGDWLDPSSNPNDEFNRDYAKYFDVDTFRAVDMKEGK